MNGVEEQQRVSMVYNLTTKILSEPGVAVYTFNPCTLEAADLCSRPDCSAQRVPGQQGLHSETLSPKGFGSFQVG